MSAHTPGPWTLGPCSHGGLLLRRGEHVDGRFVHPQHSLQIVPEEDAYLIGAAPDLLEACRRLLKFNEELAIDVGVSTHYPSAEFARAAIAKAEGRAS